VAGDLIAVVHTRLSGRELRPVTGGAVTMEGGGAVGMRGRAASRCSVAAVPASTARLWWLGDVGRRGQRGRMVVSIWQVGSRGGFGLEWGRCAISAFDEISSCARIYFGLIGKYE
jgi:hypothetical protein